LSLLKSTKKSRQFAFWFAVLPACQRLSPYKSALFDLLRDQDDAIRQILFSILQTFFDGSASFLQLANAHCRITRWTIEHGHFCRRVRKLCAVWSRDARLF
jgi:hypothetical protein